MVREPSPLITPGVLPLVTVKVLLATIVTVPPLSVVTVASAPKLAIPEVSVVTVVLPLRLAVAVLSVPMVAVPLTVIAPPVIAVELNTPAATVPPEILEVNVPTTFTEPLEMPPVTFALLAKVDEPLPERLATVIVPLLAEKLRLPALVTDPMPRP